MVWPSKKINDHLEKLDLRYAKEKVEEREAHLAVPLEKRMW